MLQSQQTTIEIKTYLLLNNGDTGLGRFGDCALFNQRYMFAVLTSFSTCPRTGPTWCNAALSAINAHSNRVSPVSSIELVWLCFSARTPRHIQCTQHSFVLPDSKAKTLSSIFEKFNISAAMCRTGNLKTGKSQNHQFSGNKSPGKFNRYTVITDWDCKQSRVRFVDMAIRTRSISRHLHSCRPHRDRTVCFVI